MAKKQSGKVQPAEEIRIGSVKAAIWKNEGDNGVYFTVTFQRLYRTGDGAWQSTMGFGQADLLVLAKVADAAHTRLQQLIAAGRRQRNLQCKLNPQGSAGSVRRLGLFFSLRRTVGRWRRSRHGGLSGWIAHASSRSDLSVPQRGLIDGYAKADAGPGKQKIGSP